MRSFFRKTGFEEVILSYDSMPIAAVALIVGEFQTKAVSKERIEEFETFPGSGIVHYVVIQLTALEYVGRTPNEQLPFDEDDGIRLMKAYSEQDDPNDLDFHGVLEQQVKDDKPHHIHCMRQKVK